jgi:hypothetical protein
MTLGDVRANSNSLATERYRIVQRNNPDPRFERNGE